MSNTRFKGILFLLSSILLGVCGFIPIIKGVDLYQSGKEAEKVLTMMPGVDGFLILVPVTFCVICALVGYQKSVPLLGTITCIAAGGALWHTASRIKTFSTTVYVVNIVFDPLSNGNDYIVSTTNHYLFGFYLTILAIGLTLVTSFMYGLADREDD